MRTLFAKVIIDISSEKVDRTFDYCVPSKLEDQIHVGAQVQVPFGRGNTLRKGYVVALSNQTDYTSSSLKEIFSLEKGSVSAETLLIELAWWMKERYGSTMNQALKTVLPVKQKVKSKESRKILRRISPDSLEAEIDKARQKGYKAQVRLLSALRDHECLEWERATKELGITPSLIRTAEKKGWIYLELKTVYRNPLDGKERGQSQVKLNKDQEAVVRAFAQDYRGGIRKTYLIHGITGSGKTEVYMELISQVLQAGKQVIVLIPEIALTYQTVLRFYSRFGDRISIMNSRLSQGERYDQFQRARKGEVDIMIGPRSALFTPFSNLGLIIIDEEHESAYKSETAPRYHARETAVKRASMQQASVVLGSATPSLEAYTKALRGEYVLFTLKKRAKADSFLPHTEVVDLRKELEEGNKSVFSRLLQKKIEERLAKGEQVMLFMNRRGYANFISCRSCGEAMKCPHCDVTLTLHKDHTLKCHYCGFQIPVPDRCPHCGSPYIAHFGAGTQKIQELAEKRFPGARILRMDLDTTAGKNGHEEILAAFGAGQADILIGTQMIVKGHDFPKVTLVGVIAADVSLYAPDFRAGEKTFQLLTQAAGRAGRGGRPGEAIIQTYNPQHYSISCAAGQDYEGFYRMEMAYRKLMGYPPAAVLLTVLLSSGDEMLLDRFAVELTRWLDPIAERRRVQLIGPVQAPVYKINDIYRKILYMKQQNYDILIQIKNQIDGLLEINPELARQILVQYDFS